MTEKFKRPFKKRHSSVYHQPSNRVNKFLSQAIEARSVDREKTAHVNRFTLNFREKEKEKSYHQDFDFGFTMSMGTSLLLLILSAGLQVNFTADNSKVLIKIKFPSGVGASTNFNPSHAVPDRVHMDLSDSHSDPGGALEVYLLGRRSKLFLAARDNCFHHHPRLLGGADECRKLDASVKALSADAHDSFQFTCLSDHPCESNFTTEAKEVFDLDSHRRCALPQYISLSAAFAFICVSIFLR